MPTKSGALSDVLIIPGGMALSPPLTSNPDESPIRSGHGMARLVAFGFMSESTKVTGNEMRVTLTTNPDGSGGFGFLDV